jgi:hypothetical protein
MRLKIWIYSLVSLLILAIITAVILINTQNKKPETVFTIISTPKQDSPFIPAWAIPKATIQPILGDNLALSKEIVSDDYADIYIAKNANDGDDVSYWEGAQNKYPNTLTVDLAKSTSIKSITVKLNPANIWEARTETFAILGSQDGKSFTPIVASKGYEFDPLTGNIIIVNFDSVATRFVQLEFTGNTAAKAGQVAEFEIY